MTILEALFDVAMNIEATAKSIKNFSTVLQVVAEKTQGVSAIEVVNRDMKSEKEPKKEVVNTAAKPLFDVTSEMKGQAVTIEQIRAVLAEKSQSGLTAKVKDLLDSFGAPKLSAVKSEDYEKLLAAAQALK